MRATNRLSSQFVKTAPVGKYCDGAGLWLVKRDDGGAQWVQRVTVTGDGGKWAWGLSCARAGERPQAVRTLAQCGIGWP